MAEPRFDATSIGEMMLRLSVPSGRRLETATQLDVYPAGAEANVISLLARLERKTSWVGALPKNPMGRLASNHLRLAGVNLNNIVWHENGRLGTYYVEFGESPRGIQVTYDRENSCMSKLQPDDLDWNTLLDTRLLHLTGITPAVSSSCREIVKTAIQKAKEQKVPISFDVNYRQKLWTESEASETLLPLIKEVELLFCSQADAIRLFNCKGDMHQIAQSMLELSQARHVVVTFSEQGALLWNGKEWLHEPARPTKILDRLGAGDALAAGVIHGWLNNDLASGLRYGVTLAAMALSQYGDMLITNKAELEKLSQGSSSLSR
ncbi:MAG: sugar kinase [Anaerolineales bacterium]|nr:sugar kinase [Anaerolineales bacterium]